MSYKRKFYKALSDAKIIHYQDIICFDLLEIFKLQDVDERIAALDRYLFTEISKYDFDSMQDRMTAHKKLLNQLLEINIGIMGEI